MRDSAPAAGNLTAKTESKTLLKANPNRQEFYAVNNGAKSVWVAFGPTATAEKGILLAKEGGSVSSEIYRGEVTAITKESESLVSFQEV